MNTAFAPKCDQAPLDIETYQRAKKAFCLHLDGIAVLMRCLTHKKKAILTDSALYEPEILTPFTKEFTAGSYLVLYHCTRLPKLFRKIRFNIITQ
jgi:hypothetical protein